MLAAVVLLAFLPCHRGHDLAQEAQATCSTSLLQGLQGLKRSSMSVTLNLTGESFPFHVGLSHQHVATADMRLLQLMAHAGNPLEFPKPEAKSITRPWELASGATPLLKCPPDASKREMAKNEADKNLDMALATYCSVHLPSLVEFYVDADYQQTYKSLTDTDGWIDNAFVAYMGLTSSDDPIGQEMDLLVQSVHHFSSKPVVVTNFGGFVPSSWTPQRFPRLVLMHARSVVTEVSQSFNFNKLTSMLFTKVKTGIALDADQWVNHGLDYLFERAAEETTANYPYPILPVHWMSRDPDSDDMSGYPDFYAFHWVSPQGPRRTMRWGHAHPTWTHYALPWLAKWTSFVLAPRWTDAPSWLHMQRSLGNYDGRIEDEDLLNMALWASNATKQWCKFDTPGPSDFKVYLRQSVEGALMIGKDKLWYPKGIAYIFFTAHDAKKPSESYDYLTSLWSNTDDRRKAIYYNGRWFATGADLASYDPDLRCMA